jgi:multiple sugar transport system substrate-binding protein
VALTWYTVADTGEGDGQSEFARACVESSGGRYTIQVNQMLPDLAVQRARLQTLMAAGESVDLISPDQTMLGDFVADGHVAPLPAPDQARLRATVLDGPLAANTVNGQVVAFPLAANTQVLWYLKPAARKAGLDMSRPVTWYDIVSAASSAGLTVQVQASKYEGYIVWLNALIEGGGGDLLRLDSAAGRSATGVIGALAASKAASPDLKRTTEFETQEYFRSGRAGFMVNWTYFWSLRDTASDPSDLGWAMYPRTTPDQVARPPLGGLSLAVPASSTHREIAPEAARCITSKQNQIDFPLSQGQLSGLAAVYDDPEVRRAYPMSDLLRESLATGAPRPTVGDYESLSAALQDVYWPPEQVDPRTTPRPLSGPSTPRSAEPLPRSRPATGTVGAS